jgi:hypothetical protein
MERKGFFYLAKHLFVKSVFGMFLQSHMTQTWEQLGNTREQEYDSIYGKNSHKTQ